MTGSFDWNEERARGKGSIDRSGVSINGLASGQSTHNRDKLYTPMYDSRYRRWQMQKHNGHGQLKLELCWLPGGVGGEVGGWQMQCVYTTVIQCLYFVYARTSLAFGWPPPHLPSTTMFIQLFQQRQIDKLGRKVRHYLLATDTFPSIQLTNFTLPNTI